ncbi:MAG: hypothetical protein KF773_43065, partial [Deltaproteobacteria bacterium]|nr:hypothetical protein [Deltaproteobacteria bacterium]
ATEKPHARPAAPAIAAPAPPHREETPAPSAEVTNASITDLYRTVGLSLKKLDATRGEEATYDLWPRYRHIRIADSFTSRTRLLAAHDMLRALERDISTRTSPTSR